MLIAADIVAQGQVLLGKATEILCRMHVAELCVVLEISEIFKITLKILFKGFTIESCDTGSRLNELAHKQLVFNFFAHSLLPFLLLEVHSLGLKIERLVSHIVSETDMVEPVELVVDHLT